MNTLHFDGRDVPPYAVYVAAEALIVGNTYFMLHYVDDRQSIPELRPVVFIGRNLEEEESRSLYFQDAASYIAGVRYDSATGDGDAEFDSIREGTPFVMEFERALDRLLYCSLTRSRNSA